MIADAVGHGRHLMMLMLMLMIAGLIFSPYKLRQRVAADITLCCISHNIADVGEL